MRCPFCRQLSNHVINSRLTKDGMSVRRRRKCDSCERRFTTHEHVEEVIPVVVKKDGTRERYDRHKVTSGLMRACEKRPVTIQNIENFVDSLEQSLQEYQEREVPSAFIGEEVMRFLRGHDQVAYVRFASVYRSFHDIGEFMDELKHLLESQAKVATTVHGD